jgi:WD40 repeat protein
MRLLSVIAGFSIVLLAALADAASRTDAEGAELPEHAAARFGSVRFRHGGQITALDVSRDGKYVVSGSHDRTVRIWEAESGKLLRLIRCEAPYPTSAVFSPDGKQIAANIDSEHVHLIEWAGDKPPRTIKAAIAQGIVWSKDGKRLAFSTMDDDTLHVYDAEALKPLHSFKKATRAAFTNDGKSVVVADIGGAMKLYDLKTGTPATTFAATKATGNVLDLRISGDDQHIAGYFNNVMIAVWELPSGKLLHEIKGADPVVFAPGGQALATIIEGRVTLIDLKSGEKKFTSAESDDSAPFAFSPDGNRLFTTGIGFRVKAWNLTTGKQVAAGTGHTEEICGLAFSRDGKSLLSAGGDGLRLWDATSFQERAAARRQLRPIALALSSDGMRLVTRTNLELQLWHPVDLTRDKPYADERAHAIEAKRERTAMTFSPNGNHVVFADDKQLVFVDTARGARLTSLELDGEPIALAIGPNGRNLAVMTRDGLVRHWSVGVRGVGAADPKDLELWRKRVQRSPRPAMAYSPDGLLIAASSAGRVVLMESVNGKQWYGFDRQLGDGDVQALAFSPDGRLITAGHGGSDGIVRVWEISTGKEVVAFHGHAGGVNAVAFAPKGDRIASAGADTSILLWDLTLPPTTGKALTTDQAWDALDSESTKTAYEAMGALIREGPTAVEVIRKGLTSAIDNQARILKLIRQLDEDDFRVRKAGRAALEKEGLRAMPALKEAFNRKLNPDTERLIRLIVEANEAQGLRIPESGLFGETLRTVRSIQILERVGGKEAIQMLQAMAEIKDGGRVAAEAKAALERIKP